MGSTVCLSAEPASSGACDQITNACKKAGFAEGQYQSGKGLWADCIDPIIRGTSQPAKSKLHLPSVNPQLVALCKQSNPSFGEPPKPAPPK
jgi:hypothetical protein